MIRVLCITLVAMLGGLTAADAAAVDVLSGDVVQVDKVVVHVANIDAPWINSPCKSVREKGEAARAKLRELVAFGEPQLRGTGERDDEDLPLAFVSVNGEDVGEKMLAAGLVQPYGKARDMCKWQRGHHHGSASPPSLAPMPTYGIRGGAGQRSH